MYYYSILISGNCTPHIHTHVYTNTLTYIHIHTHMVMDTTQTWPSLHLVHLVELLQKEKKKKRSKAIPHTHTDIHINILICIHTYAHTHTCIALSDRKTLLIFSCKKGTVIVYYYSILISGNCTPHTQTQWQSDIHTHVYIYMHTTHTWHSHTHTHTQPTHKHTRIALSDLTFRSCRIARNNLRYSNYIICINVALKFTYLNDECKE